MIIGVNTLPSKGFNCPIKSINMEPITYSELIEYTSASPKTEIDKLIWDIEKLLQPIPEWESLSAYDVRPLLFTKKLISVKTEGMIKISYNGGVTTVNVNDIAFKNLDEELTSIAGVTLNSKFYRFSIPTANRLYETLKDMQMNSIYNAKSAYLVSALKEDHSTQTIINMLDQLKGADIAMVNYLSTLLYDMCQPVKIEGGAVINNLDDVITDIFRFITINSPVDKTKITFTPKVQS